MREKKKTGRNVSHPIVIPLIIFFLTACAGQAQEFRGLQDGHLQACPRRPNCLCSEDKESANFIEPLVYFVSPKAAWQAVEKNILEMGGTIEKFDDTYMHATFKSRIFGFVDDLELRLDNSNKLIHVRSASRFGYYDFGVNRKRIDQLRDRLKL